MQNVLQKFSNEDFVNRWFTKIRWPDGKIICPRCNGLKTDVSTHETMPYRCVDCRQFFSPKFGTPIQGSRIPLVKWASALIHDLKNATGILPTELSQEIGISRGAARLMLNKLENVLAINTCPEEFKYGYFFRFDEILYKGQKVNSLKSKKAIEKAIASTQFIAICITEFRTNKVWVEIINKNELESIDKKIGKILPETAYIFTNCNHFYDDINQEKYKIRKMSEFEEFENIKAKVFGLRHAGQNESAGTQLNKGFANVYHSMSLEAANLYTKAFAGRWNVQQQDINDRMKSVFSTLMHKQ